MITSATTKNEIQELLSSGKANGVGLNSHLGFAKGGRIDFLTELEDLRAVLIQDPDFDAIDCRPISKLSKLNYLNLGKRKHPVDLSSFTDIQELHLNWNKRDVLPPPAASLRKLELASWTEAGHDLTAIPPYSCLESLGFTYGSIETLAGADNFPSLKIFGADYSRSLRDLSALRNTRVEQVHIGSRKAMTHWEDLEGCALLRTLTIAGCSPIANLRFLRKLPSIRDFRLVTTNVLDGDLSVLLELPLENIGLTDRRNFSHTEKQIEAAIAARGARTIR